MNIFNDDSNFVYLLNEMGKQIIINGIEVRALISNIKDKTIDYKKIKTIVEFKTGDYVQYQDSTWIVISEISKTNTINTIYKSMIRKCNTDLRYKAIVDGVDTVITIPTISDKSIVSISEGKYFDSLDNKITCQLGYSMFNFIQPIFVGMRFIINGNTWKVEGIDNTTHMLNKKQGTIFIKLQSTLGFLAEDNKENELAFNEPKPVINTPFKDKFIIELGSLTTNILTDKTFQIVTICKNNTTVIANPKLTYTVLDSEICGVTITGLITGIKIGTTTIKVNFEDVEATINVNVTNIPKPLYSILGSDTLDSHTKQKYKVVDSSGVDVTDIKFKFSYAEYDSNIATNLFSIEGMGLNSVDLLGKAGIKGTFTLKYIMVTDVSVVLVKNITVVDKIIPKPLYSISGSNELDSHTIQRYKIIDSLGKDVIDSEYTFSLVKYDDNTPITLINIKSMGLNYVEFLGKSEMKGTFTLKYVMNTDSTVVLLKNITVVDKIVPHLPSYKIVSSNGDIDYVLNSGLKNFKVVNSDGTTITDKTFIFTLGQSDKNPTMKPEMLVTLIDNITTVSARLNSHASNKGYINLLATDTSGNFTTKELRIKNQYDI